MKRKILCMMAMFGIALVLGLAGCGGGGVGVEDAIPDGYTRISIRGSATAGSAVMNDLGVFLAISDPFKDASDGTGGTGTGGPESIYDTAASTCLFSGAAESNSGFIDILWGANAPGTPVTVADCITENICIYCNVDNAAASSCTIACDGLVPSNSNSAADYFKIYLTAYHAFETEMPDSYGMVRIDGNATSLDTETLLSASVDDVGTDARVYANCENGVTGGAADKVTTDTVAGSGMALNTHAAGVWAIGYDITALDPLVGEVGTSTCGALHNTACVIGGCHITDKLTIIAAMTGSDTPGASLDMAFSQIGMTATICDTEDVCAQYTP